MIRANATEPESAVELCSSMERAASISTWFAVPGRHVEAPPQRLAQRSGATALRHASGIHPLPRRLHRRGPPPDRRAIAGRQRWATSPRRKTIINRWNDEFDHRPAPDYFQSFGLGFYEYFQLAEDIGARPLPILNCGMACQFNSSETATLDELDEYVQDALDLIEFANGPVDSPWGKLRAQMGHPAPFHLEMIGVGNEQWGPRYLERYKVFAAALKAKHPEIKLVVARRARSRGRALRQHVGELAATQSRTSWTSTTTWLRSGS